MPRSRTWPDVLGAVLLIGLGGSAAVGGLVFRQAWKEHWLFFEAVALAITVAGGMSWRFGAPWAVAVLLAGPEAGGNQEDYPAIYSAFPFFGFGLACFCLLVTLPTAAGWEAVGGLLLATAVGSLVLALLVPLIAAIARWARGPREDGEREARPPSESETRP